MNDSTEDDSIEDLVAEYLHEHTLTSTWFDHIGTLRIAAEAYEGDFPDSAVSDIDDAKVRFQTWSAGGRPNWA